MPAVHHLAFRTADVARLEAFYASVVGLEVVRRDRERGSVWFRAGGTVLMIERAGEGEPAIDAASRELVAFAIDDRDAWRERLACAGVAVEGETAHTLYFRDPDGRRLGVSTYAWPIAR